MFIVPTYAETSSVKSILKLLRHVSVLIHRLQGMNIKVISHGLLGKSNPNYRSLHIFIVQVHAAMWTKFQSSATEDWILTLHCPSLTYDILKFSSIFQCGYLQSLRIKIACLLILITHFCDRSLPVVLFNIHKVLGCFADRASQYNLRNWPT